MRARHAASAPASTASPASSRACAACCRNSSRSRSRRRRTRPTPLLRGVYFVSGTQEGTPIDRVLGSIARSYRLERADHRAEPGERPQLLPARACSARSCSPRAAWPAPTSSGSGAAPAAVVAGYAAIARAHRRRDRRLAGELREQPALRRRGRAARRPGAPAGADHAEPRLARPAADPAGARGDAQPRRHERRACRGKLGFGLYQGPKLDSAARGSYQRMLVDAMLPRIGLRVEEQLRQASNATETQYEALKTYLMLHDVAALRPRRAEGATSTPTGTRSSAARSPPSSATQLDAHLDALLAQGAAVSPLAEDKALVEFHACAPGRACRCRSASTTACASRASARTSRSSRVVRAAGNNAAAGVRARQRRSR